MTFTWSKYISALYAYNSIIPTCLRPFDDMSFIIINLKLLKWNEYNGRTHINKRLKYKNNCFAIFHFTINECSHMLLWIFEILLFVYVRVYDIWTQNYATMCSCKTWVLIDMIETVISFYFYYLNNNKYEK